MHLCEDPEKCATAPAKADSGPHERRRTSVNVKKDGHEDDRRRTTDNDTLSKSAIHVNAESKHTLHAPPTKSGARHREKRSLLRGKTRL